MACLSMFITYNFYFYKNQVILAESLCLSVYLYIIHADYFCQAMADLKQKYYTLILKFAYITFIY